MNLKKSKICSKGIWNESIPGISFDEKGISNFCKLQEHMMAQYPRGEQGLTEWENIVDKIKQSGKSKKYDCVIGISGGVDSSYLLHVAKEYGLRPLAVTLDNGFNTEIAGQNMFNITTKLGIDLETYVINSEEIKDLIKSYMRASLPWIDAPTDLAIKALMYKIANREGIKFIFRGNDFRSEGKQPKEWTYTDAKQLSYLHQTFGSDIKLKTYLSLPYSKIIYYGFIRRIQDIRPYYYLDYQKQKAKEFLQNTYNWEDYGGHHHENLFTKFAMAYWLPKKFNIDKRLINLSAQVLSGVLTREEAITQINEPFGSEVELEELKGYMLKKLNLSEPEFKEILLKENKTGFDYPSNYNFIFGAIGHFGFLIKRIFKFKPMSITASEILSKTAK